MTRLAWAGLAVVIVLEAVCWLSVALNWGGLR